MFRQFYDPHHIPTREAKKIYDLPAGITTLRFNEFGSLLAAGTLNGVVLIMDFASLSVVREWRAFHPGIAVYSLQWSFCGRFLLATSQHQISLFYVPTGFPVAQLETDEDKKFILAHLNPKFPNQIVIAEANDRTVSVVTLGKEGHKVSQIPRIEGTKLSRPSCGTFDLDGLHFVSASRVGGQFVVYDVHEQKIVNIKYTRTRCELDKTFYLYTARHHDLLFAAVSQSIYRYQMSSFLSGPIGEQVNPPIVYQNNTSLEKNHLFNIAVSPFSQFVAASAVGKSLQIWNTLKKNINAPVEYVFEGNSCDLYGIDWHPLQAAIVFRAGVERSAYLIEYRKPDEGGIIWRSRAEQERKDAEKKRQPEHRCGDAACPEASKEDVPLRAPPNYPASVDGCFDPEEAKFDDSVVYNLYWETTKLQQWKRYLLKEALSEDDKENIDQTA